MDLLTHAMGGFASGCLVASFTSKPFAKKLAIAAAGMCGGMLPDIDAISLWSKFDGTIGRMLALEHSGKVIYSAKFWYSHHGFFHSLLAALLFTGLLGVVFYAVKRRRRTKSTFFRSFLPFGLAFFGGYLLHLLCDMPTPASGWGGVRLFFPSTTYIGGFASIWWWNNYDIFLIILSFCVLSISLLLFVKQPKYLVSGLFVGACLLVLVQVGARQGNYADSIPFGKREEVSKKEQQRILGKSLYSKMEKLDSMLPIYF